MSLLSASQAANNSHYKKTLISTGRALISVFADLLKIGFFLLNKHCCKVPVVIINNFCVFYVTDHPSKKMAFQLSAEGDVSTI